MAAPAEVAEPSSSRAPRHIASHGLVRVRQGLLIAAFEDGNPVLYLEHKLLYRSVKGPVPPGAYAVPIGRARVARAGREATIVTYGVGLTWALEAAETLPFVASEPGVDR